MAAPSKSLAANTFGGQGGTGGTGAGAGDAGSGGGGGASGHGANGGNGGNGGSGGSGGSVGTPGVNGAGGPGGAGTGPSGSTGSPGTPTLTNATVPLTMSGPFPIVFVSVNGGPMVPVLLDTGSSGLVIEPQFVGTGGSLAPTGNTGTVTYSGPSKTSGPLTYTTYDTTVGFGNGVVTTPTAVDVLSASSATSFASYWSGVPIDGILGVGPNAGGPGTSTVIPALPGTLDQGALFNQPQNALEFGPNPLPPHVSVTGAPTISNLYVQVGTATPQPATTVFIDSGDNFGSIPSSVLHTGQTSGTVPPGTVISVYDSNHQLLYTYQTTATNGLTVTTGGVMNTGNVPFELGPVYISESPSGLGTTTFDT